MSAPGDRITVSEDKLRAVIAEFELRLRNFIDEKLEHKADLVMLNDTRRMVSKHGDRLDALEAWRTRRDQDRENRREFSARQIALLGLVVMFAAGIIDGVIWRLLGG